MSSPAKPTKTTVRKVRVKKPAAAKKPADELKIVGDAKASPAKATPSPAKPDVKPTASPAKPSPAKATTPSPAKPDAKPSPAKKPTASPSKSAVAEATDEKVAEQIAEDLATVADEADKTESPTIINKVDRLINCVNKGDIAYHKITKELKALKKEITKMQKQSKKKSKVPRKPGNISGIQKQGKLTPEMYEFTKWDPEKDYSRVDVTKFICNYIRERDLQNKQDKRYILIEQDPVLMKALNYTPGKDPRLSYPLIQRFIKVAVPKNVAPPDATAAAESAESTTDAE